MDKLLIPDVIKHFSTIITDEDMWYNLTIASDNFRKYAYSDAGITAFIQMFGVDEEINIARRIGSNCGEVWFTMTKFSKWFKKYAYSEAGAKEYLDLFLVKITYY